MAGRPRSVKPAQALQNVDDLDENFTGAVSLCSPRSLAAMSKCGMALEHLEYKPVDVFQTESITSEAAKLLQDSYERKRRERLVKLKRKYFEICRQQWEEDIELVSADLQQAVERYVSERADIITAEVLVELKYCILVAKRNYKRTPIGPGSQTPNLRRVAADLQGACRDKALSSELISAPAEWEKLPLSVGRDVDGAVKSELGLAEDANEKALIRVEDLQKEYFLAASEWGTFTKQFGKTNTTVSILEDPRYAVVRQPHHPHQAEIRELMRRHPVTSWLDCEESMTRCGSIEAASGDLRELVAEFSFGLRPLGERRGFGSETLSPVAAAAAAARRGSGRPRWGPAAVCVHCSAPCSFGGRPCKCARCGQRTYCSRECQRLQWIQAHRHECIEIQPVLNARATDYGLTASGRFRALVPRKAMQPNWYAVEKKLTELYGEQQWQGVLAIEQEAMLAAKAVQEGWPEVACGIYKMLADTYFFLGERDKVLALLERAVELARALGNCEMEAQSLVDLADIYNDCKNYGKAGQLMLSSLPKWAQAGSIVGQGYTHFFLGNMYREDRQFAAAVGHYESAVEMARAVGDALWEAQVLSYLADCFKKLKRFDKALEKHEDFPMLQRQMLRSKAALSLPSPTDVWEGGGSRSVWGGGVST